MLHLVFVACLATAPDQCSERIMSYIEEMSPMACGMLAQPELAKWNERHPNYVIRRWHCAIGTQTKV